MAVPEHSHLCRPTSTDDSGGTGFFADRILGPRRLELLAADLGAVGKKEEQAWQVRRKALERAVDEITPRQVRLMRTLEVEDDPSGMHVAEWKSIGDWQAAMSSPAMQEVVRDSAVTAFPSLYEVVRVH